MSLRDKIKIKLHPEQYWQGSSGRYYYKLWCHYTKSYDIQCLECNGISDCPGEPCDKCRDDWEAWWEIEQDYDESKFTLGIK